jgi:SAM-dependent methyltransferase
LLRDPEGIEQDFLKRILASSGGDLLEIGCGDGRLTKPLTAISRWLIGLDPDTVSIKKALHHVDREVLFIGGSGESIPLADGSFDTVVFSLSLHHHADPAKALLEALRVLKMNGRILVLEPLPSSLANRLFRIIHDEDKAYEEARSAVDSDLMKRTGKGIYRTVWRFDGFEAMADHMFGYYGVKPDPARIRSMARLLGGRCHEKPLDIEDTTQYWLLQKPGVRLQAPLP